MIIESHLILTTLTQDTEGVVLDQELTVNYELKWLTSQVSSVGRVFLVCWVGSLELKVWPNQQPLSLKNWRDILC